MKYRRALLYVLPLLFPAAVIAILFLACCGAGAATLSDRANRSLATTLDAVNATREGFLAWDEQHQADILAASSTQGEFEIRISGYRERRRAVVEAFVAAYTAIGAAAGLVGLVAADRATVADLITALEGVADAAVNIKRAIDRVKGDDDP